MYCCTTSYILLMINVDINNYVLYRMIPGMYVDTSIMHGGGGCTVEQASKAYQVLILDRTIGAWP